jgi:hypothetical protein
MYGVAAQYAVARFKPAGPGSFIPAFIDSLRLVTVPDDNALRKQIANALEDIELIKM